MPEQNYFPYNRVHIVNILNYKISVIQNWDKTSSYQNLRFHHDLQAGRSVHLVREFPVERNSMLTKQFKRVLDSIIILHSDSILFPDINLHISYLWWKDCTQCRALNRFMLILERLNFHNYLTRWVLYFQFL